MSDTRKSQMIRKTERWSKNCLWNWNVSFPTQNNKSEKKYIRSQPFCWSSQRQKDQEAELSQWHRTRGSWGEKLQMLLCFGSKAIIKYVAMRRSIFGNEYCRSTSTDGFRRKTNSADGKCSALCECSRWWNQWLLRCSNEIECLTRACAEPSVWQSLLFGAPQWSPGFIIGSIKTPQNSYHRHCWSLSWSPQ
jgi:hypothetical protein